MWRWLTQTWNELDEEAAGLRQTQASSGEPARTGVPTPQQLLVIAAVLMSLGFGLGDLPFFQAELAPRLRRLLPIGQRTTFDTYSDLIGYSYWACCKLVEYGLVPALHLWIVGGRLRDFGLRRPRLDRLPIRHIYLLCFVALFPALIWLSRTQSFQQTYPFYREAARSLPELVLWETQYAATFLAIEFFFRGYLLFGLYRSLGSLAIFVSALPYCLIHIGKPVPEMLGSIVAGILLGTLALRTGSIWGGVGLHVGVALSMDLLSLRASGLLGRLFH